MILDPVNSITSINFYRKVAKQTLGRSVLYVAYLAAIFSVASSIAMKVKMGPIIDETFAWLETAVPTMTYAAGGLSSAAPMPVIVRHPRFSEVAVMIDTTRLDPVTPELLAANKVSGYLASKTFYMMQNGKLEVYDLTKGASPRPMTIDAAFYRNGAAVMKRFLYPMTFFVTFLIFCVWKGLAAVFYSLLALIINSIANANLDYGSLLNISVYAQTLVIALQAILLFMSTGIPAFSLIALVVTGVYIWLAVKKTTEPEAAAA